MPEGMTDEYIAHQVQNGDTESFGILVQRYEAKMLRYARKFLFGYDDAQDVAQDVFIKAYIHIQTFDPDQKFSSWLYRIAHNEFINAIKKKKREPLPFFDPDLIFPHPIAKEDMEDAVYKKHVRNMLDVCLDKIDPKYREPLVLYYFEELDYKEIGDILHIPTSTIGVRLKRGKVLLKKVYDDAHARYE
ncbi:MAG TPA: RNA polymerase sigma factor [Candidatus Kapabacteria bacterium]|nr:RNA polymerase sigma factor [Candidatus Kapabacteria bacterium]